MTSNDMPHLTIEAASGQGWFDLLWRRRWVFAGVLGACLALAGAYLIVAPASYESAARLCVEPAGPRIMTETDGSAAGSRNFLPTECEIIKSTPVLQAALDDPRAQGLKLLADQPHPLAWLKENLAVEVGKKDDIISVSARSADPRESAQLVNAIVDAYVAYSASQKRSTSGEVIRILQTEKDKRESQLRQALGAVVEFKKSNGMLSYQSDKGNIVLARLARLSDALTSAQLDSYAAQTAYEGARALAGDPAKAAELGATLDRAGDALQAQIDQVQLELVAARRECTDDHPAVQDLQSRLDKLQGELAASQARAVQNCLAVMRQQWDAARQKEEEIQQAFDRQQEQAQTLNTASAELALLESDLDLAQKGLEAVENRLKELDVTQNAGALNINLLEPAVAADQPAGPQKARAMLLALVLGVGAGAGACWLRERTARRLPPIEAVNVEPDSMQEAQPQTQTSATLRKAG